MLMGASIKNLTLVPTKLVILEVVTAKIQILYDAHEKKGKHSIYMKKSPRKMSKTILTKYITILRY